MVELRADAEDIVTGKASKRGGSYYLRVPKDWDGRQITAFVEAPHA